MSNINFNIFLKWCEDRFDAQVLVKGNEIRIHSIFAHDEKFKCWCSPSGGKNHRVDGVYRCFLTDRKGTLPGLVSIVDGCTYFEAKQLLTTGVNLSDLEDQIDDFFNTKSSIEIPSFPSNLQLPEYCFLIDTMPIENLYRYKAVEYLNNRKLSTQNLFVCTNGQYENRIIIPYYNSKRQLIYYNSRTLGNSKLRYLGPPKTIGIGKGDVLYFTSHPKPQSKIYLTEGEFDALSLSVCEFNGVACGGKFLTDKQILMLKPYSVCLALDTDNAGFTALIEMIKKLQSFGIKVSYVRPPQGYKDWNDMLVKLNSNIIKAWIEKHEQPVNNWTTDMLLFDKIV